MGHRRAQDRDVEHPVQLQVVGELPASTHQAPVLLPEHPAVPEGGAVLRRFEVEPAHRASSRPSSACSAAHRTERTMVA